MRRDQDVGAVALFPTEAPLRRPTPRYAKGPLEVLREARQVAIDCETTSPHPMSAALTHVAFATDSGYSGFVDATEEALAHLPLLLNGRSLVMHNAVYDLVVLARHGVSLLHAPVDCTRALSHLLDEHSPHDLKSTAARILGHREILGFRDLPSIEQIGPEAHAALMADKGRVDCEETLEVFGAVERYLREHPQLRSAYTKVEQPLLPVLSSMTLAGVPTDLPALEAYLSTIGKEREEVLATLAQWAGFSLDPDNDDAVTSWLYGNLGLTPAVHTATGAPAVNRDALAALRHPAAALVAKARRLRGQMESAQRWRESVIDGRTHLTFSAWSRATGEITVSQPFGNTDDDQLTLPVRDFIVAEPGKTLVEVRLRGAWLGWLAHLSRDPLLMRALDAGMRPADAIAEKMGIRNVAGKAAISAWLDALCNGKGPRAVARAAGCRQKEAIALGERLRSVLPQVFRLKAHLEEAGRRRGWVQTPMGRRLRFEPRYTGRRALSEVLATAESDVFKLDLRRLWEVLGKQLVLAVRRTALIEVDNGVTSDSAQKVRRLLGQTHESPFSLFDIDIAVGNRWANLRTP